MDGIMEVLETYFPVDTIRAYSYQIFNDEDLGLFLIFGALPCVVLIFSIGTYITKKDHAVAIHRDVEPNAYVSSEDDSSSDEGGGGKGEDRDEMSMEELMKSMKVMAAAEGQTAWKKKVAREAREAKEDEEKKNE